MSINLIHCGNEFRNSVPVDTGSSFDLYPKLLQRYKALTFNGDVDACVPFNSNADWVSLLAQQQGYETVQTWRPWLLNDVPAGYVTKYSTPGPGNFTFVTVKEAGHMIPTFQPERAFALFQRWLNDEEF